MKYLKKYEGSTKLYKYGDIVVVDPSHLEIIYDNIPHEWKPLDFPVGEVITGSAIQYYTGFISHVHKILRQATPQEIEEFKARKNAKKYNL